MTYFLEKIEGGNCVFLFCNSSWKSDILLSWLLFHIFNEKDFEHNDQKAVTHMSSLTSGAERMSVAPERDSRMTPILYVNSQNL